MSSLKIQKDVIPIYPRLPVRVTKCQMSFSCFVIQKKPISSKTFHITNLKVHDGHVFNNNQLVSQLFPSRQYFNQLPGDRIISTGHNIHICHVLTNALGNCNLYEKF